MNDLEELTERARKSDGNDTILKNDKDFYYAVGVISYLMASERKLPRLKHRDINFVTLCKTDTLLKRRLNNMFMKTNQTKFIDTWKGILVSQVLTYNPNEDIEHFSGARECITAGFNYGISARLKTKDRFIDEESISMQQMTHNEFQKYQENLAKKIWNQEIEYNVTDFVNDTKKVYVIDYDLDKYNIPDEIKILINEYMKSNKIFENHETFFGHIDLDSTHYMAKLLHCEYGIPFGYAGYYRNNDYMMIINYAEGDFNVSLYTDKQIYNNAVIQTHNFYESANFYLLDNDVWTEDELHSINVKDNPNICIVYEKYQETMEDDLEME